MKIKDIKMETRETNEFPKLELMSRPGFGEYDSVTPKWSNKTLTYPANRVKLYEQLAYDQMLDSMYKDNTIFTAYDMTSRRRSDLHGQLVGNKLFGGMDNFGVNPKSVANIMMPRSESDIDEHNHEFVTAEASLMSRGAGTIGGAVGSGIATMASEIVENVTKGYFSDRGEAIGTPTRATYKGADHRTKTYSWRLTPRNPDDLFALLSILRVFALTSYGYGSNSRDVESTLEDIAYSLRDFHKGGYKADGSRMFNTDGVNITLADIIESFKYIKVMSNPTLWYIRNYNHNSLGQIDTSIFGPANIVNMKINKTPNGQFQGLSMFPNLSAHYDVEITFREALSHTRDTVKWVL